MSFFSSITCSNPLFQDFDLFRADCEAIGCGIGRKNGADTVSCPPEFLEIIGRLFQIVALVSLRDQFVKFRKLRGFAVKVEMFFFVSVRAVNRQSEKCNLHCSSSSFCGKRSSRFLSDFLECQQIVKSLLRFGAGFENRLFVVLQNLEPRFKISQIVLAELIVIAQISGDKSRADVGDQFLKGVGFVSETSFHIAV